MTRPAPDPMFCLRGSVSSVTSLKFQNEDLLYSGHTDGNLHVWSMKTKRIMTTIPAHSGHTVLWVELISDRCMLTQGRNGEVKIWNMSPEDVWAQTNRVKSASLGFCRGCLLDKQTIALPGEDQSEVNIHDLESGKVTANLKGDISDIKFGMCMTIKAAGSLSGSSGVWVGYENGSVALWDTRANKMVNSVQVHEESVMCMAYSEKLEKGVSGSANDILKSWTHNEDGINMKNSVTVVNPGFNDVIIRDDDKIIVTAGWDSRIRIFGAKHLRPLAVLNYHKDSVNCLTFSNSKLLACGSKDTHISLWDIYR